MFWKCQILNNGKKIVKPVSGEALSTNLSFSSIAVRKDKQKLDKSL